MTGEDETINFHVWWNDFTTDLNYTDWKKTQEIVPDWKQL